ncbi:carboxypeptidase-like regulatory domain-containing protein [Rhodothermus marinus]|uniref:carboxypeptidase-like regulatory domain-containing protein n=1 Tax=Rhodothermus marinus TaxID=29549 RepID=UPI001FB252A7|nr:carboxypeptidase-like regulatory domain-containing protein [Rhodothermus marinus]
MRLVRVCCTWVALLVVGVATAWAQTGKIAGVVTDAETGEPLPGVNVVIEGTRWVPRPTSRATTSF